MLSQMSLDASVGGLANGIQQAYELILENRSPSKINPSKEVLVEIAQIVQECVQFIVNYSEIKIFCALLILVAFIVVSSLSTGYCLGKSVSSETATKVAKYNLKLQVLMQELRDRPVSNIQYGVKHIYEDIASDFLDRADGVGLNEGRKCLDGTRTEILSEIVDWINNTDAATPRIFWLYGQAGKGKSAIAHTIALHAKNLGQLGSCFCFSRVRQHEGLHTKTFPTIAHDLADHDLRIRPLLDEAVSNSYSSKKRANVLEQWRKLILEPLSQLEGSFSGNVVIVVDALDEWYGGYEGGYSPHSCCIQRRTSCQRPDTFNVAAALGHWGSTEHQPTYAPSVSRRYRQRIHYARYSSLHFYPAEVHQWHIL